MVMRVYERALQSTMLDDVIVATDDERIYQEVKSHGGKVVVTSTTHRNGTERCAEVSATLETDYIINIQGDEPYIDPRQIDLLAELLDGKTDIGTLIKPLTDQQQIENPSIVKVVKNLKNEALYFSRSPIPYHRASDTIYYKHIGIYAYRKDILQQIVLLNPTPLELSESLEQLRWLENGYRIRLEETDLETISIDTPEDLNRLNELSHA